MASKTTEYKVRSLGINLADAIKKVKSLSWQPIQSLFDNPDVRPMMVFSKGEFIFYGDEEGEIILGRDIKYVGVPSRKKTELVWFFQKFSFGESFGEYRVCKQNITHWFAWPEPPEYNALACLARASSEKRASK